jgi:hypothetical protein
MIRLQSITKTKTACLTTALVWTNLLSPTCFVVNAQTPSVEELQQEIKKRDVTITDLLRRVEALEQKIAGTRADQAQIPVVETTKAPTDTGPEVEEIMRALERTLVREGGLVLPKWSIEVEPRFNYTYRGLNQLQLVEEKGETIVAQQNAKRDTFDSSLSLRLGLPFTSQLDVRIPYSFDRQELATAGAERKRNRSGLGDVELAFTKQLLQEKGWVPDLLTSVGWKTNTGHASLDTSLPTGFGGGIGNGFNTVQATLTGVKRRDPLAFFGSVFYNWSLSGRLGGNAVDLGDTVGFRIGSILATSPDTSFRFALDFGRSAKMALNHRKLAGSESTLGVFEFGLATIILPRTLLDVRAGIGLTPESPDFRLGISMPIRLY